MRAERGAIGPSTHRFTQRPGGITWESRDASRAVTSAYAHAGSDVPKPGDERVRLNLWRFGGRPPDGLPAEVTVSSFSFTP